MMNEESNVLPCPTRAFSNITEGVILKVFSGGKPPHPQRSTISVETIAHDKCFSMDPLHLKGVRFIAIEEVKVTLVYII